VQKISDHVYTYRDSRGTNFGLVLAPEGAVLVDSPMLPEDTRMWRDAVTQLSPRAPLFLINTDHHLGHALGNWAFPNTPCITHRHSAFIMLEKYDATFRGRLVDSFRNSQPAIAGELENISLPHPRLGVADEMTVHVGDIAVELIHVGGHTPGTVLVRVPSDGALFTGDIVVDGTYPNLGDANSEQWLAALQRIKALNSAIIVPGHGETASPETLEFIRGYIQTMRETVGGYYESGMSRKDVVSKVRSLEGYPIEAEDRARAEQRLKASLQRVYDEYKERDKELDKARDD
jgi:cyclase